MKRIYAINAFTRSGRLATTDAANIHAARRKVRAFERGGRYVLVTLNTHIPPIMYESAVVYRNYGHKRSRRNNLFK